MASGNSVGLGLQVDKYRVKNVSQTNNNNYSHSAIVADLKIPNVTYPSSGGAGKEVLAFNKFGSGFQLSGLCQNPGPMTGIYFPVNQYKNNPTTGLFYSMYAAGLSLGTNTSSVPTMATLENKNIKEFSGPILPGTAATFACPNPFYIGSSIVQKEKINLDGLPTSFIEPSHFRITPSIGGTIQDSFNIVASGSTISFNADISKSLGTGKDYTSEGAANRAAADGYTVENVLAILEKAEADKEKQQRENLIKVLVAVADKFLPEKLAKIKEATFCLLDSRIQELWQKETIIDTSIDKGLGKFGQVINTVKKVAEVVQTVLPVASAVVGFFSPTGKASDIESVSLNDIDFSLKDYTVTLNYKQRIERLNSYLPLDYKMVYIEGTSITLKDKVFSVNENSPTFNAQLIDLIIQLNTLLPETEKLVITWDNSIISTVELLPGLTINNQGIGLTIAPNKFNPLKIALKDLNCFIQGDEALIDAIFLDEDTSGEGSGGSNNPSLLEKLEGYLSTIAGVPANLSIINLFSDKFLPVPLINDDESINVDGFINYGVGKVNSILPDWAQIDVDIANGSGSIGPLNITSMDGEFKLGLGSLSSLLQKANILNKIDWIPFLPEILKDIQIEISFPLDTGLDISLDESLLGESVDNATVENSSEGVATETPQAPVGTADVPEPPGGNSSPPPPPEEGVGGDDTIANNSYTTKQAKTDAEAEAGEEPKGDGTIITSGLTTDPSKLSLADSMQIVKRVLDCISDLMKRDSTNSKKKSNALTNTTPYLTNAPACNVISLKLPELTQDELIAKVGKGVDGLEENINGEEAVPCKLVEVAEGFVGPVPCEGELVPCKLIEVNKDFIGPIPCIPDNKDVVKDIKIPLELPDSVFDINKGKLNLPENNNTYKTAKTNIPKRNVVQVTLPYSTSVIETSIKLPIDTDVTSINGLPDNVDRTITLKDDKGAIRILKDGTVYVRINPTDNTICVPYTTADEAYTVCIKISKPIIDRTEADDAENEDTTIGDEDNPITNIIIKPLVTPAIIDSKKDNKTKTIIKKGDLTKTKVELIKSPSTILSIENSSGDTKALPNKNNPTKRELPLISYIKVINDSTNTVSYENNPSTDNNSIDRRNSGTSKVELKPSDRLVTELEELGIPDAEDIVTVIGKILDISGEGILNKYKKQKPKYVQSGALIDLLELIMKLSLLDQSQVWGGVINTLVPKSPAFTTNTRTFISNNVPLGCSRINNLFNILDGSQQQLDEFIVNYLGYPRIDAIRVLNDPKYITGYLLVTNPSLVPAIEYLMLGEVQKFFNELIYYKLGIDTIQEGLSNNINSLVSTAYGIPH